MKKVKSKTPKKTKLKPAKEPKEPRNKPVSATPRRTRAAANSEEKKTSLPPDFNILPIKG